MFNIGSDDKENLQENMKEIKSMIQEDQGQQQDSGLTPDGLDSSPSGQRNQQQTPQQQNSRQRSDSGGQEGFGDRNRSSESGLGTGPGQAQRRTQQQNQQSQSREKPDVSRGFDTSSGEQDKPVQQSAAAASSKQNSSDEQRKVIRSKKKEGSDEPIFLGEQEFRDVREMVEEMSYLSQEMQESLEKMKSGVREERENSRSVQDLIEAYSKRRKKMESSIKSAQK
jgi:hypothetical protein